MRPPFHRFESYRFHALNEQVDRFIRELSPQDWARFAVAAQGLVRAWEEGRAGGGYSQRIRGSIPGLFELRITRPGAKGPQLRLLCVRDGQRVLCARGVEKRQAKIPRHDIELAVRAVKAHRSRNDDGGPR